MAGSLPRRRYWVLAALLLVVVALGAGVAVHADREAPPVVQPYDPLPRW
jgi:hypothetical protein